MTIEDDARAEAERQYPGWQSEATGRHRAQRKEQEAFVAGAAWQARQPDPLRAGTGRWIGLVVDLQMRSAIVAAGAEGDDSPEARAWVEKQVMDAAAPSEQGFVAWQFPMIKDVKAAALVDRLADDALAAGISASRVNDLRFVAKVIRTDAPKAYETKEDTHE